MNLEERQKQINNLIMTMAHDNPNIKPSQVARAKSLYLNDTRPLEEIAKDLDQYSEEVRASVAEKAHQEHAQKTQAAINTAFAEKQAQPAVAEHTEFKSNIDEDLSDLYAQQPQPEQTNKLGDIVDAGTAIEDPTDELDSMFEASTYSETDFAQVEVMGDKEPKNTRKSQKVLVKTNDAPARTEKAGFSTVSALITLTSLLSIMGIIISALIIYSR